MIFLLDQLILSYQRAKLLLDQTFVLDTFQKLVVEPLKTALISGYLQTVNLILKTWTIIEHGFILVLQEFLKVNSSHSHLRI